MQRLPPTYGLVVCGAATLFAQFTSDVFAVLRTLPEVFYGLSEHVVLPSIAFELPRRALAHLDAVDVSLVALLLTLAAVVFCGVEVFDCLVTLALAAIWGYGFVVYAPLWDIVVTRCRTANVEPTEKTSRDAKVTATTPRLSKTRECATEPCKDVDTVPRKVLHDTSVNSRRSERRNTIWERDPPSVRVVVPTRNEVMVAPPGDLFLVDKILKIRQAIEELDDHLRVTYDFIRVKAQRDEYDGEWEIARKQKYQTEMARQRLLYQKEQYDEQQDESVLTVDRTALDILGYVKRSGGFAVYTIVVSRKDAEGRIKAGWVVQRRYSEFEKLHEQLKNKDRRIRDVSFPLKRLFRNMDNVVLESRRQQLRSYLETIMQVPEIVNCEEVRRFLCKDSS